MYSVTKIIQFCYGHRLLNYSGKCRYLHGHNGTVEIELAAKTLDRRGMVRDFTEIKRAIQGWIDAHLDHKMILCQDDPVLPTLRKLGEPLFVIAENPTAENIAKLIYREAARFGFPVTAVRLWETESSCAIYRPATTRPRRRTGSDAESGRNRGRSPSRPALRGDPDGGRSEGGTRHRTVLRLRGSSMSVVFGVSRMSGTSASFG